MTKKLTQQDIRSIVSEVVASRKTISEQDETKIKGDPKKLKSIPINKQEYQKLVKGKAVDANILKAIDELFVKYLKAKVDPALQKLVASGKEYQDLAAETGRPGVAARTAYMKAVDAEELELAKEILALLPKQ